jgi:hypothetical protein
MFTIIDNRKQIFISHFSEGLFLNATVTDLVHLFLLYFGTEKCVNCHALKALFQVLFTRLYIMFQEWMLLRALWDFISLMPIWRYVLFSYQNQNFSKDFRYVFSFMGKGKTSSYCHLLCTGILSIAAFFFFMFFSSSEVLSFFSVSVSLHHLHSILFFCFLWLQCGLFKWLVRSNIVGFLQNIDGSTDHGCLNFVCDIVDNVYLAK